MNNLRNSKQGEGTRAAKVAKERIERQLLRRASDREEAEAMAQADVFLEQASAEMAATHERMAATRVEIDRLKAESREVLIQSRRILEEIKNAA